MTLSLGLFLIGILGLSCLSTSIFKQQNQALAQNYIRTIKYTGLRNEINDIELKKLMRPNEIGGNIKLRIYG
jgi:hypothetical protein